MTRLHQVATLSIREGRLEPVLSQILDAAIDLSGADFGTVQLLDAQSSTLKIAVQRGLPPWWVDFWQTVAAGEGACGVALERRQRVIVEDVENDPFFADEALEVQRRAGVRAVQCTPLVTRAGRPVGMFSTHYRTPHRPDDHALRILDLLARQAADTIARVNAERALRESEERLSRVNAELAEADRLKDEFLAVLSHELRNPLAPIRYALPMLQREAPSEPASRAVGVLDRQVNHLTRLVDDLLDVSRITRGQIELRREYITLDSVISAAVEAAAPAITAARHTIELAVIDEPVWLHADATRLAEVITNLLNNSAKYTPRGGRITLTAERRNGNAIIRVRDTGMGIAADVLPTIFDMFRQARHSDRSQGGLGIGLTLVKRLVEMHGGAVDASSAGPGKGSEFTVRLPVAQNAEPKPVKPEPPSARGRKLKVLVVDDNADLVEMLAILVEGSGHEVRKALDGRSAISAALSYRPDLVLLDLGLPVMSGLDVARELRRQPEMANTHLVALTGWGQAEDRRKTHEAGFNDHLTKPADPERLRHVLERLAAQPVGGQR